MPLAFRRSSSVQEASTSSWRRGDLFVGPRMARRAAKQAVKARHDQERERAQPEHPQFGRDLEPHVVRDPPPLDHHLAVVILELPGADPGYRVLGEDLQPLLEQLDALLARSARVLVGVDDRCPCGPRTTPASPASPSAPRRSGRTRRAGCSRMRNTRRPPHRAEAEETAPRLRQTIATAMTRTIAAAIRRRNTRLSWNTMMQRRRQEDDQVHREIVGVLHEPADRAAQPIAFDEVDAAHVVEDRRATTR